MEVGYGRSDQSEYQGGCLAMAINGAMKLLLVLGALFGFAAGIETARAANPAGKTVSGSVQISQVQVAFIGSGNLGGGTLRYRGKSYEFTVGGLGVGGFGISKMEAVGEVYDLRNISQFSGLYGQARYGAAVGNASTGELWLQNNQGVTIHLKAKRQGLALSLGVDGVAMQLK
jgi:hypothetical protein